jgi:hypothetical protein
VIAIRVPPSLHTPAATGQDLGTRRRTVAFQGQHHGAGVVPLSGVAFLGTALPQLFQIVGGMSFDLPGTVPPVSSRVCPTQTPGATLFSQARKNIS